MSKIKMLKPTAKQNSKTRRNDGLTQRVTEVEEQFERMKRDTEDILNNIDSGNLGEELIGRLSRIEKNISSMESRLTAIEKS